MDSRRIGVAVGLCACLCLLLFPIPGPGLLIGFVKGFSGVMVLALTVAAVKVFANK